MSSPQRSWSDTTTAWASVNCSRYQGSIIAVSSGRPHMFIVYQRGRGHEPVTVAGSIRSFVAAQASVACGRGDLEQLEVHAVALQVEDPGLGARTPVTRSTNPPASTVRSEIEKWWTPLPRAGRCARGRQRHRVRPPGRRSTTT